VRDPQGWVVGLMSAAGLSVSVIAAPPPAETPAKPADPQAAPAPAAASPLTVPVQAAEAPAQPAAAPAAEPAASVPPGAFRFGPFAEGIDLRLLIETIMAELDLPFTITDQAVLSQKVYQPYPITVPREELLWFVARMLEQKSQSISRGEGGIYVISPSTEVVGKIGDDPFSTTQIIPTSGLRPSSLQTAINVVLRSGGGVAANAGMPGGSGNIAFLDDLGLILMTDSPRKIETVRQLVLRLAEEQSRQGIARFDLTHIAASVARQRLLELLGRPTRSGFGVPGQAVDPNAAAQAAVAGMGGSSQNLSNLADRLIPDPQSNALIFRGREDESEFIKRLLTVVDTPNQLKGKFYPVGSAAIQLAQHGKRQGLGEIVTLPSSRGEMGGMNQFALQNQQAGQFGFAGLGQSGASEAGGPMFVIDPEGRGFMYYGTEAQQTRVDQLVEEFRDLTASERIVIEAYKLRHGNAATIAEIMNGLLQNQTPTASAPLLPGQTGQPTFQPGQRLAVQRRDRPETGMASADPAHSAEGSNDLTAIGPGEDVFVLADEPNNQILVKSPKRLQPQFKALIDKLDLRRPQVYIDAQIVSVTDSEDFRLAFETQLINAGGSGGVINTNFGLSSQGQNSSGSGGNVLNPKDVFPLGGLTAAIIKSEYVPIIINAIQRDVNGQILATPQLLVDDNEEAEVSSLDQRPTTTSSQSGSAGTTLTGFGGFEPAGPKLRVKPQISEGNYLKLEYEVELSNFVGDSTSTGGTVIPPQKLENKIKSASVTVPSDSTIVVGGLTYEQTDKTVIKVPLLGDIPLVGQLFRDERDNTTKRTLYVFITPRIMRDPNFADLRLLTRGPQGSVPSKLRGNLPEPSPERMPLTPRPGTPLDPAPVPVPGHSEFPGQ
jgi:type II secretory pathway component GspD/PulD (secretin)